MSSETDTFSLPDSSPNEALGRVDEAVCGFDDEWRFTFVNSKAATMLEHAPEELLGEDLRETVLGIEDGTVEEKFRQAMGTQEAVRFDHYDGSQERWFQIRLYPSEDGVTACFYDITDERGEQLDVQRKRRLLETMFEQTKDALVVADTDRRITDFNSAAEQLFGYDTSEVMGEKTRLLYADPDDFERQDRQRFNENVPEREQTYIMKYERADGTTFDGETLSTSLRGPNGEAIAFLGSIRDISTRIEYEQEIKARNDALRTFHEVTTDESRAFDEQLGTLLELGSDHLGLDIGFFSRIDGDECIVEHTDTQDGPIQSGDRFDRQGTYCDLIAQSGELVATRNAGESEYKRSIDPELGFESYIGAPVVVDGEQYGTLNFSGTTLCQQPFAEGKQNFVRVLAQWIGKELSRQQNHERATANRKRLRQIVDMLPQLVFAKNRNGEFLLANQAVAEIYGTTVEDLEGATDADFAESKTEARQFREDDLAVIDSSEPKRIQESLTTADGEEMICRTTKIPYDPVDHDGEAVLGVATDITARKERERERELQAAAMEAAMDGIAILDDGEYIYMNQAYADVFDFEAEELLGSGWRRLYGEPEVERLESEVFPAIETDGEWRGETVGKKRDGSPVNQEITLSLLDDGKLICTNHDITDRKERERELERQQTRLRALFDESPDSIIIHDATGKVIDINETQTEALGYDREELLSMNVAEFEVGFDQPELEAVWADMDDGGVLKVEGLHQRCDGSTFPVEVWVNKVEVHGRERFIALDRNITERKQREQELETKTTQLEAILENTTAPMFMKNADREYVLANRQYRSVFGFEKGDVVGKTDEELHPTDMAEQVWENDNEVLDRGESIEVEEQIQAGDDERIYLTTKSPIYGLGETTNEGSPDAVFGVSNDITQRTERERELEQTRARLERVLRRIEDGFCALDDEWRITYVNDAGEALLRGAMDIEEDAELLDRHLWKNIPGAVETVFYKKFREAMRHQKSVTFEEYYQPLEIWYHVNVYPDENGISVYFSDITERKRQEEKLRTLKERLDMAVDGATLGVWDWNVETDAVTFNEQWAEMLGLSLEEIEPTLDTWEALVHPDDAPRVEQQLTAHLDGEVEVYDCEHRMQTANGDWKWIRDVGEVVERDDDGTPLRAVGIHIDISEQKESQRALEEEREMFAQGPAVVFKWENGDGWPVEYVSENVTETFGYTPSDLRSGAVAYETLIHDQDSDRVSAEVEKHSHEGTDRISHDPYRIVTAEGDVRWVQDNTKIIREDGEITHYLGYLIDITERKRLEDSLRESREALRDVTAIGSDTNLDFEAKLEAILELGCDRLGLPYGFLNRIDGDTQHVVEATGTHSLLQAGESAPLSKAYCRRTIERDEVLDVQDAVDEGWGDDPAYETFGLGCYIGGKIVVNGKMYGTLCFADSDSRSHNFDETERAFVELLVQWISYELASNAFETKLEEINETSQQLITARSREEIAVLATESAKSVLDMRITGVWWHDESTNALVPARMTEAAAALLPEQPTLERGASLAYDAFETGEVRAYDELGDVEGLHNEDTVLASEALVPFGDYGLMSAGSTERRPFSEADLNLLEVLSSTVKAALSRAAREQELRETQQELKQSNEELEQFAYAASHDLQEPLRTVSSYLTLLQRRYSEDLDDDAIEFIDFAVSGADRMRDMIQALLAYSRVDTRGQNFEPINSSTIFERVTQNLKMTIEETDATVSTPATELLVFGDENQLVQLFQNLVGNGIKYNSDPREIDVSITRQDERVTVAVTDNGIGMQPDQTDDIFEVFNRLHTREEFDGTGVGLSICRKIVERHGGEISVESEPDDGSTFTVVLPLGDDHDV